MNKFIIFLKNNAIKIFLVILVISFLMVFGLGFWTMLIYKVGTRSGLSGGFWFLIGYSLIFIFFSILLILTIKKANKKNIKQEK